MAAAYGGEQRCIFEDPFAPREGRALSARAYPCYPLSMSFVNGLGGTFIYSPQPERLARWYESSFGLKMETYGKTAFGLTFAALDTEDHSKRLETVFSIMLAKSPVPTMPNNTDPDDMYGDQPYMVNLRVDDMKATLEHLRAQGIEVIKEQDEGYGLFSWVRDPDGHRIELWQPLQSFTGGESEPSET